MSTDVKLILLFCSIVAFDKCYAFVELEKLFTPAPAPGPEVEYHEKPGALRPRPYMVTTCNAFQLHRASSSRSLTPIVMY